MGVNILSGVDNKLAATRRRKIKTELTEVFRFNKSLKLMKTERTSKET